MSLWPFPPQRLLKERMEWMTEVIRSPESEQRIALRTIPRWTFSYDFVFYGNQLEAATQLSRNYGASDIYLPVWSDRQFVGTVSSSTTLISVDTTSRRFIAGGKALLIGGDGKHELLDIDSVTDTDITLVAPGVEFGVAGGYIMPAVVAKFKKPFSFRKSTAAGFYAGSAEFTIVDDFETVELNEYDVYSGSFVLSDRPIDNGITDTAGREFIASKNISGPLHYGAPFEYAISTSRIAFSLRSQELVHKFRKFCHSIKGKQKSFFVPRWSSDFSLSTNILSANDSLLFARNSFADSDYTGPICIIKKDGTFTYCNIESWSAPVGQTHTANLSEAVGENITIAEIEMITRMPRMRSNSDNFEFSYTQDGGVDITMPIMEVTD